MVLKNYKSIILPIRNGTHNHYLCTKIKLGENLLLSFCCVLLTNYPKYGKCLCKCAYKPAHMCAQFHNQCLNVHKCI